MSVDARGWRIALIADLLLNPGERGASLPDVLPVLETAGYGLLQLPPPGPHHALLAVTADQVAEYSHHGYAVVAIGVRGEPEGALHWRRLVSLLRRRNAALPPRHLLSPREQTRHQQERLALFLRDYDLAPQEQQRWRV